MNLIFPMPRRANDQVEACSKHFMEEVHARSWQRCWSPYRTAVAILTGRLLGHPFGALHERRKCIFGDCSRSHSRSMPRCSCLRCRLGRGITHQSGQGIPGRLGAVGGICEGAEVPICRSPNKFSIFLDRQESMCPEQCWGCPQPGPAKHGLQGCRVPWPSAYQTASE